MKFGGYRLALIAIIQKSPDLVGFFVAGL